jgi:hypothetical protein
MRRVSTAFAPKLEDPESERVANTEDSELTFGQRVDGERAAMRSEVNARAIQCSALGLGQSAIGVP